MGVYGLYSKLNNQTIVSFTTTLVRANISEGMCFEKSLVRVYNRVQAIDIANNGSIQH